MTQLPTELGVLTQVCLNSWFMFFPGLLDHITYLSLLCIYLILLKVIAGTLAELDLAL